MTPGVFAVLLATAILLLTAVGLDSVAPASCSDAKDSLQHGLTEQAAKQYRAIRADDPGSACAATGTTAVLGRQCAEARERVDHGLLAAAEKQYLEVLDERPLRPCGHRGMALVSSRLCDEARRLRAGKATEEATKAYQAILVKPGGEPDCAIKALAELQAAAKKTADTKTSKAAQ